MKNGLSTAINPTFIKLKKKIKNPAEILPETSFFFQQYLRKKNLKKCKFKKNEIFVTIIMQL